MTTLEPNSETKRLISDKIVRHHHTQMSVKASFIISYFLHVPINGEPDHNLADGLIYFSGDSFTQITLRKSTTDSPTHHSREVIGLFPKVFLAAYTTSNGIHICRSERTTQGRYRQTTKYSNAADYFDELKNIPLPVDDKTAQDNNSQSIEFKGGLAGFIGYDLAAYQQIDTFNDHHTQTERLIAAMGHYDIYLKKEVDGWALYGSDDPELNPIYQSIINVLHIVAAETNKTDNDHSNLLQPTFHLLKPFSPAWSSNEYVDAFKRIQEYLRAGDCYQVNLTQPFIASVKGDLIAILDDLLQLTQAPYSGYMRVGEHEILSCSPELFLSFSGADSEGYNQVITRPIKGTRPRSLNVESDEIERKALNASEKDRSENLMIVDLLRHDLSRHAVLGSVEVPALFEIESFAQVHHLVSEVRATLRKDASALDVLIDALPGGSITGAPKKRAMEIIAELEAMPRGAYCGSLGYLNYDGSGQFNILIRTLQKYQDSLVAWAGGGITIASDVDAEYQECLDKISAILDCVNGFGQKI